MTRPRELNPRRVHAILAGLALLAAATWIGFRVVARGTSESPADVVALRVTDDGGAAMLLRRSTRDGVDYRLSLRSPDGTEVWQRPLARVQGHERAGLILRDGDIVVAAGDKANDGPVTLRTASFSPSGQQRWSRSVPAPAFVGGVRGPFLAVLGETLLMSSGADVTALDGISGELLWSHELPDNLIGLTARERQAVAAMVSDGARLYRSDGSYDTVERPANGCLVGDTFLALGRSPDGMHALIRHDLARPGWQAQLLALPKEIAVSRLTVCGRYRDQWIVIAEAYEMILTALSISVSTNAIEWHSRWPGRFRSDISAAAATTSNELPPFVPHHGYDEHGKPIMAVLDVERGRWRSIEPSPSRYADETSLSKQGCWLIASSWELVTIAGDTGALTAKRTHDLSAWAFGERQTWLAQSPDAWAILDPCTLEVRGAGPAARDLGR